MKPKKQERQSHEEGVWELSAAQLQRGPGKKDKDRRMRAWWGGKKKAAAVGRAVMTMTRGERAAKEKRKKKRGICLRKREKMLENK